MPLRVHVSAVAALWPRGREPGARAARRLIGDAARAALRARGVAHAELSLTLLDDDGIAALNERWLTYEGPTDVIAFALHDEGEPPLGDVYIGLPQAIRQAAELGVPLATELARLAVHGTLHVLGFDHPQGPERVESEMWREQERILHQVTGA